MPPPATLDEPDELDQLDGFSLWDGERDRGPVRISWSGDRIEAVDPADSRHPGLAVIPGLIDTHVHLDTNVVNGAGPGDAWPLVTPPEEQAVHVLGHALRFAAFGVTTLRDLAASSVQIAVGRALNEGAVRGPRLLAFGPVGMTAGHGDLFTPPRFRDRPPVANTAEGIEIALAEGADSIEHATGMTHDQFDRAKASWP